MFSVSFVLRGAGIRSSTVSLLCNFLNDHVFETFKPHSMQFIVMSKYTQVWNFLEIVGNFEFLNGSHWHLPVAGVLGRFHQMMMSSRLDEKNPDTSKQNLRHCIEEHSSLGCGDVNISEEGLSANASCSCQPDGAFPRAVEAREGSPSKISRMSPEETTSEVLAQSTDSRNPKALTESCAEDVQDLASGDLDVAWQKQVHAKIMASLTVSKPVFFKLKSGDAALAAKVTETGCTVTLPKKWTKPVHVHGSTEEAIENACTLLKAGGQAVKPPQLTHFLSVRLTHPLVRERFEAFRAEVRDIVEDRELLPDRLFQRPEKLHMSLAMLSLPAEADRQRARDVVEECCRQARLQPPPAFRLRGLGAFGGGAARTRVLFARPEPAEPLQALADLAHGRLCDAGLGKREKGGVTLHATLMNTTFLTRGAGAKRWRKFRGFDSAPIVERLGEYDFGEVRVEALEISSLTEKADDGYYSCIGRGLLCDPLDDPPGPDSTEPPAVEKSPVAAQQPASDRHSRDRDSPVRASSSPAASASSEESHSRDVKHDLGGQLVAPPASAACPDASAASPDSEAPCAPDDSGPAAVSSAGQPPPERPQPAADDAVLESRGVCCQGDPGGCGDLDRTPLLPHHAPAGRPPGEERETDSSPAVSCCGMCVLL